MKPRINFYTSLVLTAIVAFVSIYWFTLPLVANTLFATCFAILILRPRFFISTLTGALKTKITSSFLVALIILIAYSYLIGIFSGDYSYSFLLTRQIPYFISAIVVGRTLGTIKSSIKVESILLYIGAVQGAIVLSAALSPEIRMQLLPYQGAEDVEFLLNEGNFGVRGFALAAQQFFGLSSMISIQCGILTSWMYSNRKGGISLNQISLFCLFGFACLLVGRTSGLVFLISLTGLLYVSDLKIKLFILAFYVAIANTLQQNYVNFEKMIDWAFELFVSFIFHGRIRSESLSDLTENMLFIPNINQILIGDGLYSDVNTVYYLGTDSGYLRPVLFGGILTLVILIAPYTYVLKHYHFKKSMIVRRPYVIYPFMLAAIIQVKGEVFLSGTMSNVLVILYLAYYSVEVVCEDEGFPNQD